MDEKQMLLALMLFFDFVCIAYLVYVGWLWRERKEKERANG